jgi:methionyl aminopeptidase
MRELFTKESDIQAMRQAGQLASEVLDHIAPHVQVGTSTEEIDRLCHAYMRDVQKTIPAPLNYQPPGYPPFPKAICTSVNDVICHGIPSERILKSGDIVNIDITVITPSGYFGDTSRMFLVGEVSIMAKRLSQITFECMWLGIAQVKPGAQLGDIGHAIQSHAEKAGYSVVREYCGHGIGKVFHQDPQILHYGKPKTGDILEEGMTFTIEPMINAGKRDIRTMPDLWTVKTKDRSLSAQWEHTVLVTQNGVEVLTISQNCPEPPEIVKPQISRNTSIA